jgi:hypothetical protein
MQLDGVKIKHYEAPVTSFSLTAKNLRFSMFELVKYVYLILCNFLFPRSFLPYTVARVYFRGTHAMIVLPWRVGQGPK